MRLLYTDHYYCISVMDYQQTENHFTVERCYLNSAIILFIWHLAAIEDNLWILHRHIITLLVDYKLVSGALALIRGSLFRGFWPLAEITSSIYSASSSAFGLHHLPRELYRSLAAKCSIAFKSQLVT